jgi:hypothetical protein
VNKKLNQLGIGIIELLAFVVIIGIVGFTGWYVWHGKQASDKTLDTAAKTSQAPSTTQETTALSQADIEKASAVKTTFAKLPQSLQAVVVAEVSKESPDCVKDGKLVDANGVTANPAASYASVGSAIITIGCTNDSGAAALFAKDVKSGEWKFVEATQAMYMCDSIFQNPVPKALLQLATGGDANCTDAATGNVLEYDVASQKYFY